MHRKFFAALGGVLVASSAFGFVFNAPSYADSARPFSCNEENATTVVGNNKTVIRWRSSEFDQAGYSPSVRCREVSDRFNQFYNDARLNFITAGIVNGVPVVCAVDNDDGEQSCNSTNVLFTLNYRNRNHLAGVLQRLFNNAGNGVVLESSGGTFIDVKKLVDNAGGN